MKILERSHKKQQILDFINNNIDTDDPFKISKKQLSEKLSDEHYNEKEINELIEELIYEGLILKKSLTIEIIYPKIEKEKILKKWKGFIIPYNKLIILILLYIIINITIYFTKKPFFESTLIIIPPLFGIAYLIFQKTFELFSKKIPYLKDKMNYKYLYTNFISIAVLIIIIYISTKFLEENFTTTHLLGSITCGIIIGNFIYKCTQKK